LFFEFTLDSNCIAKDFYTKTITAENRSYITRIGTGNDMPSPNRVGEMVALLCLADDNNTWDKYSTMLCEGTLKLSELVSCREDVFFYLKSHGFVDKDAFLGMNWVHKGRGLPVITDEMRVSEDNWVLAQCEKGRRLPSRATILEYLFFMLKALISAEILDS
jgi:DNA polymerase-3 subunit alpha (Gram-positive type)